MRSNSAFVFLLSLALSSATLEVFDDECSQFSSDCDTVRILCVWLRC